MIALKFKKRRRRRRRGKSRDCSRYFPCRLVSYNATREERVWLQAFQMAPILSPLGRSKTKTIASTKNRLSQFIDASTVWVCSIILGIQWDYWSSTVQGVVQMASQNLTTLGVPSFRPFYLFFLRERNVSYKREQKHSTSFFTKRTLRNRKITTRPRLFFFFPSSSRHFFLSSSRHRRSPVLLPAQRLDQPPTSPFQIKERTPSIGKLQEIFITTKYFWVKGRSISSVPINS